MDRNGEIREHKSNDQGLNQPQVSKQEPNKQGKNQEWIPVISRKSKPVMVSRVPQKEAVVQGTDILDSNNPFNPILVEEGEIVEDQPPQVEEDATDGSKDQGEALMHQDKSTNLLVKSKSAEQLSDLENRAKHQDRELLIKSSSLSDLPKYCKESRLEYLKEEFNHLRLVGKYLQRSKEETQQRMKMLEERQRHSRDYQKDIQQYLDSQDQETDLSQVPETQSQKVQGGESSQKKKKGVQVGKKPLTRAAKKNQTPRRS